MSTNHDHLVAAAKKVRACAYATYSGFLVGAALQDERGQVFTGCNVENSSFPEGSCAEANAIGAMIAGGGRKISVITVVGGHTELQDCSPCGGCRQRIREFSGDETRIVLMDGNGEFVEYSIDELLPMSFQLR
jgi:cytidine deaminase